MPKPKRKPREPDPNVIAKGMIDRLAARAEGRPLPEPPKEKPKNPAAVALSKLGASKGGKARAKALKPKERAAIARRAAETRWAKKRQAKRK